MNQEKISFPKREWEEIKKILQSGNECSSIRCCQELDKYIVGKIYETPWGEKVKITKKKRYLNPEDIPTWNLLDKGMKISVGMGQRFGGSKWDHIYFIKVN